MRLVRQECGSALIIVLAFVAFTTLIVANLAGVISSKQESRFKSKILDSRRFVLTAALRNARASSYYYSALTTPGVPVDPHFLPCMLGDDNVLDCDEGVSYGLTLVDETPAHAPVLGGSAATAVHYDIYGQVCSVPTPGLCIFDAWATFKVACPRSGSPCRQAATIEVTVSVQPIASVYPPELPILSVLTGTEVISISNFIDYFNPTFPPIVFVAGTPGNSAQGAPLSGSAGVNGPFHNYVQMFYGTGLCIDSYSCSNGCTCVFSVAAPPSGGGGGGGGGPPPIPPAVACPAGTQSVNGGCMAFNF